jgi:hypothetical protein
MAETLKKRRSIGKTLGIIAAVFVLLLVVVYFVATSAAFLKGVILPKVSASLGADVTVADASISPFKSVRLQKLKVQTPGQEPFLVADEVIARYSLMDIIGGKINVDEVTLVSPVIKVIKNADGTSNLDALTKKDGKASAPSSKPESKPAKQGQEKPPQIDIKNVSLQNATIQQITTDKSGARQVVELSNVNVKLDHLKNGASGNLSIASQISMNATTASAQASTLVAKLAGAFDYSLEENLLPKNAKGKLTLDVDSATGTFADVAKLNGTVDCDISPTEIKDFALRFAKNGSQLGAVRVSGPFDAAKVEGKLKVEVSQIDKQVLNIFGGPKGMDFGSTKINSVSDIELTKGGQAVAVVGQLLANSFAVTRTNQTTPAVDLQANYSVSVDLPTKAALIKTFTFTGTQNKQPLLNARLSKPMTLDWGKGADAVDESAFVMEVTSLNLADWKAFAGEAAQAGQLNMKLDVLSKRAGKDLDSTLALRLKGYSGQFGSNKVDRADINVASKTHVTEFDKVDISDLRVDVAQAGQEAVTISANGNYSLTNKTGDIQATISAALKQLGHLAGQPELAQSGQLNAKINLSAKDKGETLVPNITAKISDFSGKVGSNRIDRAGVDLSLRATMKNSDKIDINELRVNVTQADQTAATVSASGNYGVKSQEADLKANVEAALPKLAQLLNNPDLAISSGAFRFNGTVKQKAATQTIAGDLVVDKFTGHYAAYRFNEFIAAIQTDIEKQNDAVQIRKLSGELKQGGAAGGTFSVNGNIDTKKMAGQLVLSLKDLNEHTLRTFLQPTLGDKKLISVLINGNATAQFQSQTDFSTKADFAVTNLVVQDPKKAQPESPLAVQLNADAAAKGQVFDLRQVTLGLTPTERGKNQLQVKGLVDTSKTNALKGNLNITAESIDITKFYDLYAGKAEKEKAKATSPSPSVQGTTTSKAPAKDENKEPEAMKLPIQEFALDINIGQFYLREIAITNLQAVGKVVGNKVNLNPVQLAINGAPVKANVDLDLGVAGYTYNVTMSADRIPLEPLANSFIPEKKGQYKGDILANIQIKGAGTTGVNLKKNLSGQVNFSFTNANIKLAPSGRIGGVLKVIAIAIREPGLLDSPLNWVDVQIGLGNGQINLRKGEIVSPLFKADTAGIIPIANVLMDSPLNKLPVDFYLSRSLAQKLSMMPANTPADAAYVLLPRFGKLTGTLGKPEVDKVALTTGLGTTALNKIAPKVGGTAGTILQGVGGLLGGQTQQPATTNAPSSGVTNPTPAPTAPATNNSVKAVNDIINIFKKKK